MNKVFQSVVTGVDFFCRSIFGVRVLALVQVVNQRNGFLEFIEETFVQIHKRLVNHAQPLTQTAQPVKSQC